MALNVHLRSLGRALWYNELTAALEEAEQLLLRLAADGSFPAETSQLCLKVAAIRSEVERFNRITLSGDRIVGVPWAER